MERQQFLCGRCKFMMISVTNGPCPRCAVLDLSDTRPYPFPVPPPPSQVWPPPSSAVPPPPYQVRPPSSAVPLRRRSQVRNSSAVPSQPHFQPSQIRHSSAVPSQPHFRRHSSAVPSQPRFHRSQARHLSAVPPRPGFHPEEGGGEEEDAIGVEHEEAAETFTDYRPQKLSIGPPHPDPIVETSSLSGVQPPEPTYSLAIMDDLEGTKKLSCLQIESLVYASQRHLHHLPSGERAGFFIGDGAGVGKGRTVAGLIWENWYHGRRKSLWISVGSDLKYDARRDLDDMGANCIEVHALNKLPYSNIDSDSVGIYEGVIFSTYTSLISASGNGRTRLQQLVQWCGPDFDGLIIFDECHKAKNLVPEAGRQKNPTRTGLAVVEIQALLPQARVVYCSATGASEPRNMAYMVRLGLWGDGTCFREFSDFLRATEQGGVGALELVAMDMKARGMYVCRTLSHQGSEFEVVEVPLEAKTTELYAKASEFWVDLRKDLMKLKDIDKRQLWMMYWGTHQRFFRHILMSAKVAAVVKIAKQALMEDKCVVIGLQSTGEAQTEGAVAKCGTELDDFVSGPRELLLKFVKDYCKGVSESAKRKRNSGRGRARKAAKREALIDVDQLEDSTEEDDVSDQICGICNVEDERKNMQQCSTCGQLVHPFCLSYHSCKEKTKEPSKEGMEGKILSYLEKIQHLDLPNNPLDDIIDQLGGPDNVAEITGRRGMLVRGASGTGVTYQSRGTTDVTMEMVNTHEKQLFMDGEKLVAIISEAGSAGVSLQADRRAVNQRRRVHLTLELPWSADRAIQQFGRTHRSNQASAPQYKLLITDVGGERRFASTVAKRLESLGALIQGDRRAGAGKPSLSAYNYDSKYGAIALEMMYDGILGKEPLPVVPPGCSPDQPESIIDFIKQGKVALKSVGIVTDGSDSDSDSDSDCSGTIKDKDKRNVARFLNRLLGLAPGMQNRLFELFVTIFDHLIENARTEGNLETCIVDVRAKGVELKEKPKTVHVDSISGASTQLYTFTFDRGVAFESALALLQERHGGDYGFYKAKREWMGRRQFLLALDGKKAGSFRIFRPGVGDTRKEMSGEELKDKYSKISSLEIARVGWEEEYDVLYKQCSHGPNCNARMMGKVCTYGGRLWKVNVLGGIVLPIWSTVVKALSMQRKKQRIKVVRIETSSETSQRVLGLLLPSAAAVETLLQDLNWIQDIDD